MNSTGSYAWKFKVQRVDPLTPQHETIRQASFSLLATSEDQGRLGEFYFWLGNVTNDCAQRPRAERVGLVSACLWHETVITDPLERPQTKSREKIARSVLEGSEWDLRLSKSVNGCSETFTGILNDCLETLDVEDKDCFETLLKILNRFKDSQKDKDTSSTQDSSNIPADDSHLQTVEAVTDTKGDWSLEKLLTRADKKNRQILLDQENNAIPFVSWVIHGASQSSIQNPFSLAIARLKENPGISASGASDRLAAIPPKKLVNLIEKELAFRSPSDRNWRMIFAKAKRDRIRLLADSLGLILDIQEEL
jgi:hypothetical protein